MADLIPYISGLVTILFSLGFYYGLQELKEEQQDVQDLQDIEAIQSNGK